MWSDLFPKQQLYFPFQFYHCDKLRISFYSPRIIFAAKDESSHVLEIYEMFSSVLRIFEQASPFALHDPGMHRTKCGAKKGLVTDHCLVDRVLFQ